MFSNISRLIVILGLTVSTITGCGDSSGEFEYVAIGASDAVGIGATPLDKGYVFLIQDGLKDDGRDVGLLNLGIPDVETDEMRKVELPVAVKEGPELVTIFAGANDVVSGVSTEDFQHDLSEILSDLASKTGAVVAIATLPDLTQLPRFQSEPDDDVTKARVDSFNQIIRDEAAKSGAHIVELASQPVNADEVSDDGFHPNNAGYERIADQFLSVIRPLLPPV